MNNSARRVALLARPGAARDRMREALDQAGANVVLEADPTATDQAAVLAAEPEIALVVLDSATDEALERFDALLSDPKVDVLFEEAELAVGRVGWDAARWVRHLSAKLRTSDSVLPPGREGDVGTEPAGEPLTAPGGTTVSELPTGLPDLDLLPIEPAAPGPAPPAFADLELVALEPVEPVVVEPVDVRSDVELVAADLGDGIGLHLDEPASPSSGFELELADETPTEIRIEGLELEEDQPADATRFQNDLADLHSRIAALELVDDQPAAKASGAVLVLAGIGGPDAVRQLLGALPEAFPRPVLVQQRLDGGHYDKLVAQMQRATTLPVRLAAVGDAVQPATVYIVPPTVGLADAGAGLEFTADGGDVLASMPANDSAVLMLSGSDPAQVDAVMKLGANGALIAAQALDGCYDVAAPAALASRGGQSGKPPELARRLAERWH